MTHYQRALKPLVLQALGEMPAVFINGPRQAGKSTLSREISEENGYRYLTFDDTTTFAAAINNPQGFVEQLSSPVVIDEIQMVPEIFRSLKKLIDEKRYAQKFSHGQFLLTGSANIMALPELSDALVGRMSVMTLYPFSMREIKNKKNTGIQYLLDSKFTLPHTTLPKFNPQEILTKATYPQIASQKNIDTSQWFESYLSTLLQRDVKQLAEIEKLSALPLLLRLMATRAGGLLNDAMWARDCDLNQMTFRRYRQLLQHLFLLQMVPPWHRNISKRFVKSPKVYLTDTALICFLSGLSLSDLKSFDPHLFGHVFENFVATELIKQLTLYREGSLYHFRTQEGKEIDFIIEKRDGKLIAIEIKSRASVDAKDFSVMRELKKEVKTDFQRGIVFYMGKECIPFDHDLVALPISYLWE